MFSEFYTPRDRGEFLKLVSGVKQPKRLLQYQKREVENSFDVLAVAEAAAHQPLTNISM